LVVGIVPAVGLRVVVVEVCGVAFRASVIARELFEVSDDVVEGVTDVTDGADVNDVDGPVQGCDGCLNRIVMGLFTNRELPVWGRGAVPVRPVH